jgi:hypothetical protein
MRGHLKISAMFNKVCELAMALGWENIALQPGCQSHQVDERWWFAINPHPEPTACEGVATKIPPYCIYLKFNGWPAGIVGMHGGMMAAGGTANEDNLMAALNAAIEKASKPA